MGVSPVRENQVIPWYTEEKAESGVRATKNTDAWLSAKRKGSSPQKPAIQLGMILKGYCSASTKLCSYSKSRGFCKRTGTVFVYDRAFGFILSTILWKNRERK